MVILDPCLNHSKIKFLKVFLLNKMEAVLFNIVTQIFTIQEAEMVEATNGGMTARARKLISLLDRKTDDKLLVFVQCLRAGAHSHVADMFDGEGKCFYIQSRFSFLWIYHIW